MFSWRNEAVLGVVLTIVGLVILAANLEVFNVGTAALGFVLFGGTGFLFLTVYRRDVQNWWAAFPTGALFGLAAVSLLESVESVPAGVSGGIFLWACAVPFVLLFRREPRFFWASIPAGYLAVLGLLALVAGTRLGGAVFAWLLYWAAGVAFAAVFLRAPSRWWSIIPAGTFFSLGLVALLQRSGWAGPSGQGFVFCLGLAATFAFLFFIRNDDNRLRWAKYPSIVLLVVSILFLFSALSWGGLAKLVSLAMVIGGLYLLVSSGRARRRGQT